MVNTLRTIATVLVQLCGGLLTVMGLGVSTVGTILPYRIPHSHLYTLGQLFICGCAVLIGVATLLRFRIAAMGTAACFLALCIEEAYGMAHGFELRNPPHYSHITIALQIFVGFIPGALMAFAWPSLRSDRYKSSNQAMQRTAEEKLKGEIRK